MNRKNVYFRATVEYEAGAGSVVVAAVPHTAWTEEEVGLLVGLIVRKRKTHWPASTDNDFWELASHFLRENGKERTGTLQDLASNSCLLFVFACKACNSKVHRQLRKMYRTPEEALQASQQSDLTQPLSPSLQSASGRPPSLPLQSASGRPPSLPLQSASGRPPPLSSPSALEQSLSFSQQFISESFGELSLLESADPKPHASALQIFRKRTPQLVRPPTRPVLYESAQLVQKVDVILEQIHSLSYEQKMSLLQNLFVELCQSQGVTVKKNFLELSISSMKRLETAGRRNVGYDLVRGIGTTCQDGSGPRFPVDRMPMGLFEYVAKFFAEDSKSKVIK